jgi:hypothetical protein
VAPVHVIFLIRDEVKKRTIRALKFCDRCICFSVIHQRILLSGTEPDALRSVGCLDTIYFVVCSINYLRHFLGQVKGH